MSNLPELGVGIVYLPGLEPLIEAGRDVIDVIEIEPQTFWFKTASPDSSYRIDKRALERLASYPHHKIIHGVGFPVGGTLPFDREQLAPFIEMIVSLRAPWASEHLSFSRANSPDGTFSTGFFLPPLQTPETVAVAAANICELSAQLPVPFAFETGVNYLQPVQGEMSDGAFFRAVAETADCGIVLDLHNLWCNQINGRQTVLNALKEMPLERIWEVHLAGGDNMRGYWLDAHSGLVPSALMHLARDIVPWLPNLKALIFEIVPDYMPTKQLEHSHLLSQLKEMQSLWQNRRSKTQVSFRCSLEPIQIPPTIDVMPSPSEWESTLAALVLNRPPKHQFESHLTGDRGIEVLRELVASVRTGIIVESLMLTYRLIVLSMGEPKFLEMLREFWKTTPPELFATQESQNFADFLMLQSFCISHLKEVLAFELALCQVRIHGEQITVRFTCDPLPFLTALGGGRLPDITSEGEFELTITP